MATMRNAATTIAESRLEGSNDMAKLFKHQLFLTSISNHISDKVLEARKDNFAQSLEIARHKHSQKIAGFKADLHLEEAKTVAREDLTEEEIMQVAAIWARNKRNSKSGPNCYNNQAHSNGPRNPNVICRYCQKKGYMQKECHSRHRDNAPMTDANVKPYKRNRVNNVTKKSEDWNSGQKYEDAQVGAIANISHHHLKW